MSRACTSQQKIVEDGGLKMEEREAIPISKTRSTRATDNPVSRAASKRGRTKCSPSRHILSYFLGSSYSAGDCCRERQKGRRTDSLCVFSTAAMGLHAAQYQPCNARHSTAQHSTAQHRYDIKSHRIAPIAYIAYGIGRQPASQPASKPQTQNPTPRPKEKP